MADVQLNTLSASVKAAYEANADTEVFTSAEKTKLSGIADGATVNATYIEDTDTSFSGDIPDLARLNTYKVYINPASNSTNISTGLMRISEVYLDGVDMTGNSHAIAGYDYLLLTGNGDASQHFIHESKLKKSNTGAVGLLPFYQPSIDAIAGTISNLVVLNNDIDLSAISGTVTTPYLIRNIASDFKIDTAGLIVAATGNEVPSSHNAGVANSRYYFSEGWGSSSTGSFTTGLLSVSPPVIVPARTTFNRIGIEVTTGGTTSTARLGVYDMLDGLPNTLIYDAGTVDTTTTGEKEVTGDFTLEAGSYFLAYQEEGGAASTIRTLAYTDYDLIRIYGNGSGNPAAATVEDYIYVANTGALPSSFGSVTRTRVGAVPSVWIREV